MKKFWIVGLFVFAMLSCSKSTDMPKPYGYFRLSLPDTSYVPFSQVVERDSLSYLPAYPFDFDLSENACLQPKKDSNDYWMNIHYPSLNADIHCTYKPVSNNLKELTNDALEFVYKHASYASSIPEHSFDNPDANVYGVLMELNGNTASPCQFFVTDSSRHFFRASVYCYCKPNADSLAPLIQYLHTDVQRMIESFRWKY